MSNRLTVTAATPSFVKVDDHIYCPECGSAHAEIFDTDGNRALAQCPGCSLWGVVVSDETRCYKCNATAEPVRTVPGTPGFHVYRCSRGHEIEFAAEY